MSVVAAERAALRVGGVALVLLLVAILFVVGVWGRIEVRERVRFTVGFSHVGSLRDGASVQVAGKPIGRVERISFGGREGELREVTAHVVIDSRYASRIPVDAVAFVSSRGMLGARYLELGPGTGNARAIANGDHLTGIDPPSLDRTLQTTWERLEIAREFVAEVAPAWRQLLAAVDELAVQVGKLEPMAYSEFADALAALQSEARRSLDLAEDSGIAGRWDLLGDSIDDTRGLVASSTDALGPRWQTLRTTIDALRSRIRTASPDLAAKLSQAMDAVERTANAVGPLQRSITALLRLAERGTLMRVMRDPEFPEDARELGKILKRQPWRILGHPADEP